jgi:putative acetyltransferase
MNQTTGLTIRAAIDADSDRLIALMEDAWRPYPGCVMDVDGELPELRRPASHWLARGGQLWVCEQAESLIGSIAFDPIKDGPLQEETAIELHWMYVDRAVHGRGVAQALYAKALDFARTLGAARIELWTDTRFLRAHAFYEKLGFQRSPGSRELHDLSHTVEYHYALTLAS